MVHKGEAYITEFGSAHATEKQAEYIEMKEEKEAFSSKLFSITKQSNSASNVFIKELGDDIYNYLPYVITALNEFKFIIRDEKIVVKCSSIDCKNEFRNEDPSTFFFVPDEENNTVLEIDKGTWQIINVVTCPKCGKVCYDKRLNCD